MRTFTLLAALLAPFLISAQNDDKRDYTWILGDPPNIPQQELGGSIVSFQQGTPSVTSFNINHPLSALATISDDEGNLVLYSNGCYVINQNHEVMEDGSPLNPGKVFDEFCDEDSGYPIWQSIIALPVPNSNNRYGIFHLRSEYISGKFTTSNILYSEARVEKGSLGKVTSKNTLLAKGEFSDYITAVRHGNGRDWWVMAPDWEGEVYHVFLLTPDGYKGPMNQISQKPLLRGGPGQIVFSPDGSWLADCRGYKSIRLARFDRCEGRFYDEQVFDIQSNVTPAMGAAFSPNSSVLYVTTPLKIYQYNMKATDIANSQQIVAEYDGFKYNGLPTTFFQSLLGPDNKIYLSSTNGTWHLHTIHQPDSLGVACMVEQHALKILGQHSFCMPNFPHFRLYDLHGSPCDTLGINGPVSSVGEPKEQDRAGLILYPVPATDLLNVQFGSSSGGQWRITDLSGRTLLSGQHPAGIAQATISVASLPSGSYSFSFQATDGTLNTRLFTVLSR